jgi:glycine hydroxymethyltransferase
MHKSKKPNYSQLERDLIKYAQLQDKYDRQTTNLIAPASPTPLKYLQIPLKYNAIAEGLVGNRPYAGARWFNKIERLAAQTACDLFHADHANVQPHSVSQANQAVYQALLPNNGKALGMKFHAGGHLTHGLKINFSGRFFNFEFYGVDQNGFIDYNEIEMKALKFKPKLIVCGASSYPRKINFKKIKEICDKVSAFLLADLSHPAGLIVAGEFPQPFPWCDVVTFTTDKTMLGVHGGIVLCKKELKQKIDKAIHPGTQSSIPLRRIYQIAQCLIDCGKPWFKDYIKRLLSNMRVFEKEFDKIDNFVITGGSDTHLMVVNTYDTFNLTGKSAETLLEKIGLLTNRQVIPQETLKPYVASGIRLGVSWITARGYNEKESKIIAQIIIENLRDPSNKSLQRKSQSKLEKLTKIKRENDVWLEK